MAPPPSRHANLLDCLTAYLETQDPRRASSANKLLIEQYGQESKLFHKLELQYGVPVIKSTLKRHGRSEGDVCRRDDDIYDRLTDSQQYTGAHRHRFGADGIGLGLAGRDRIVKGGGNVHLHVQDHGYTGSTNANTDAIFSCPSQYLVRSDTAPRRQPAQRPNDESPPIFDRLTDSALYTGAHKFRFDQTGKGRGLNGRDAAIGSVRKPGWHKYEGDTNTGTDYVFLCPSEFLQRTATNTTLKR
ncbi:hypothetical protein M885DRAFT_518927 [Pelagophyceae sp. CCMP2097]|nr:hypothetical protein M885DRAFT_518927 [Pelagophyceae sp. CCMP2097]